MASKPKFIPQIRPTEKQREWLDKEQKRTGNSVSTIVRNMIQERIDKQGVGA